MAVTTETLVLIYRTISDATETLAMLAQAGDADALELIEYLAWASNAVGQKLAARLAQRLNKNNA